MLQEPAIWLRSMLLLFVPGIDISLGLASTLKHALRVGSPAEIC